MSTETVKVNVISESKGSVRSGVQRGALIAPLDAGATVSANVVKTYRRVSDAEADHNAGSYLAEGVEACINTGLSSVITVGMAARSGSPFTETFSADNGTLDTSRLPLTEVTAADNSGTGLTVKYTHKNPDTLAPGTTEIYINTDTGDFRTGAAVTASSLSITYTSHDVDAALDELDLHEYEYHTFAGFPYNDQYYGIYKKLLAHANTENKLVAAAYDSGVTPADVKALTEAIRNARFFVVAGHYTGDLTSALVADRCISNVSATAKEQVAPAGATYTDSYKRKEYGDDLPSSGDVFHHFGANAIFKDKAGTYRYSNDRACVAYNNFFKYHSTQRSTRFAQTQIENRVLAARRSSGQAFPFTDAGLHSVRAVLIGALGNLRDNGVIDEGFVDVPSLADIPEADRSDRVLDLVDVKIRLPGQIHVIKIDLGVDV